MSRSGGFLWSAMWCLAASLAGNATPVKAQSPSGIPASQTCAGLLANDPPPQPAPGADSARPRSDTVAASIGGARTGAPDILFIALVHADEVRFATQPRVRVRLCWAGDTLTVVRRDNLPTPVVAGTTYRNVFVAVELLGRLNAECLLDRLATRAPANRARSDTANLGNCAFLGARAAGGQQPVQPPSR